MIIAFDQGHALPARSLDFHRITDTGDPLLDLAQFVPLGIPEDGGVAQAKGFAIDFEYAGAVIVLDEKVVAKRGQFLDHTIAIRALGDRDLSRRRAAIGAGPGVAAATAAPRRRLNMVVLLRGCR